MKNRNIEKFDKVYKQFLSEKDPLVHFKAMKILLSEPDLKEWFTEFIEEKDSVKNFFLMWKDAYKYENNQKEKEGLKRLGIQSKKLYIEKNYKKLAELFFDITLRHLVDFIHLEDREDFEKITDVELYEKGLIPDEIYFQFFLIETMIKRKDFDWNRGEVIINQSLACFIICFLDINAFFNGE
jgi:hypothetical protein